jgi:hypothetical protein
MYLWIELILSSDKNIFDNDIYVVYYINICYAFKSAFPDFLFV